MRVSPHAPLNSWGALFLKRYCPSPMNSGFKKPFPSSWLVSTLRSVSGRAVPPRTLIASIVAGRCDRKLSPCIWSQPVK